MFVTVDDVSLTNMPRGFESSPEARAQADLKFTYVVSCQIYGQQKQQKKPEATDISLLLQRCALLSFIFLSSAYKFWGCNHSSHEVNILRGIGVNGISVRPIYLVFVLRLSRYLVKVGPCGCSILLVDWKGFYLQVFQKFYLQSILYVLMTFDFDKDLVLSLNSH